jgi:cell division protein FtsB
MFTRQRRQSKVRPLLLPLGCLFVISYFTYHGVEGDYGLFALGRLEDRVAALEQDIAETRAERERIGHLVALLRPESLDRDMLDERARHALNLVGPKDLVIMFDPAATGTAAPAR